MSEQDKVTLFGVVFSAIVVLSVLAVSAKDVYGWLYRKLTKRAPDVLHSGHCEHVPDGQYCPYCKDA